MDDVVPVSKRILVGFCLFFPKLVFVDPVVTQHVCFSLGLFLGLLISNDECDSCCSVSSPQAEAESESLSESLSDEEFELLSPLILRRATLHCCSTSSSNSSSESG